ncbi:hypothetical protein E2562_016432 [Oryza meyeriana var. granulata]|uniref:F-box domain-containing protein n=1 Tax=Oryza meyeriana var. granulata TaxID=110450 RepID=A0A6G1EX64_9ORYZ|nr:hypothetical protein E2562_016432 [Oryza meyeriana var. granulata]
MAPANAHGTVNLWRSVPCINIDFNEFDVSENQAGDEALFKRFVNRLLELPDPVDSMVTFCLRYSMSGGKDGKAESADANRWIRYVLQEPTMLVEVVAIFYALELDHSAFTSSYLRNIRFANVFLDKGFFKQIQTGCPALEDLFLHDCIVMDDEISFSKTLEVLTIDVTKFHLDYETSISTPSVTSLTLLGLSQRIIWALLSLEVGPAGLIWAATTSKFSSPRSPEKDAPTLEASSRAPSPSPSPPPPERPRPPPVRRNVSAFWAMEPEQETGRDRLSDLPDDLICRIMSFLHARQAVRTCVLSQRWRDLWRSLTRITADFCDFNGETDTWEGDQERFRKFVNNLLLLLDPVPVVDKFWLRSDLPLGANVEEASADAHLWIGHALQLQASVVEVDQDIQTWNTLELGGHAWLTGLSAVRNLALDFPVGVNSPKLEKLTLEIKKVYAKKINGKLKETSFTCENLKIVEVICLEDDPLVNRVKKFFFNSGMTSLQINITYRNYFESEVFREDHNRTRIRR